MPGKKKNYYYRIYDDKEQFNYIKSSFQEQKIRTIVKKYEKVHDQYYTAEFIDFLRKHDRTAELIDVTPISY